MMLSECPSQEVGLFLRKADILVTDYSGVWIDFLLLDRPIVSFCPDLVHYKENRGFLYDYKYNLKTDFDFKEFAVIFAYHWEAINFLSQINNVYKIGLAGDPINYAIAFRYQRNIREYNYSLKRKVYFMYRNLITNYALKRSMVNALNKINPERLFNLKIFKQLSD